ncbi:MAG TPA: membrane dipeptidase [Pyrinomonadaceae bacterium]|nr:membrane dipeptidase [Pyrinomonadaceae bacterium]
MNKLGRGEFITTIALALAGVTLLPRFSMGKNIFAGLPSAQTILPVNEFGIVDLHCHPSLKMYLWNKKIWKRYHPSSGTNPFPLQYTVDELASGYVKGLLVAHYLVEAALTRESAVLKKLFPLIKRFCSGLAGKVEHEDYSNFTQINLMIDTLETQIHLANEKQDQVKFVIARDFSEFERALSQSRIPIAHAIEGAHALGRNFPLTRNGYQARSQKGLVNDQENPDWYLRNLEALKARGVCLMTIAHIFQNDLAFPVEGISPDEKHKIRMAWTYTPEKNFPLRDIGKIVVQKMLDIGMVVDLTHMTPAGREDVFRLNKKREAEGKTMRPLTFTHAGAQYIFEKYDAQYNHNAYDYYKFYDASDEEIDSICQCGGTIGIIPENFWLIGCDTNLNRNEKDKFKNGIDYIVETIEYINSRTATRNYDNISIGTDFDGFADAPNDLYKPSQLPRLIEAMRGKGISEENIKKITSGNALRLLRNGWGNPS